MLCFRTTGSGVFVTTKFFQGTLWPSATSGRACLQTSTPPMRGMMGSLSFSRVGCRHHCSRDRDEMFGSISHNLTPSPGDRYWVFSEASMDKDSPKSLKDLGTGLPRDKLDAALYYTPTGQTYFFRGNKWVNTVHLLTAKTTNTSQHVCCGTRLCRCSDDSGSWATCGLLQQQMLRNHCFFPSFYLGFRAAFLQRFNHFLVFDCLASVHFPEFVDSKIQHLTLTLIWPDLSQVI